MARLGFGDRLRSLMVQPDTAGLRHGRYQRRCLAEFAQQFRKRSRQPAKRCRALGGIFEPALSAELLFHPFRHTGSAVTHMLSFG